VCRYRFLKGFAFTFTHLSVSETFRHSYVIGMARIG
jgi:hypothetical protein